jgi:hypothetical protein
MPDLPPPRLSTGKREYFSLIIISVCLKSSPAITLTWHSRYNLPQEGLSVGCHGMKIFKEYRQGQTFLLPPSLIDYSFLEF